MEESRIFVLACDSHLATIYRKRLEVNGIEVVVVEDMEDIKHKSAKMRPQVIVLDKHAVDDIFNSIKQIKALATLIKTKVMILARSMTHNEVVELRKAGADSIDIFGHFSPHEFVQKIRKLVQ